MIMLVLLILWEISLVLARVGGFFIGRSKKRNQKPKPTETQITQNKRLQKELENFYRYDGTPQDVINDQ